MSFVVRGVQPEDLKQLVDLAKQFALLNLPGDKKIISQKIERSVASFAGELSLEKSEYLFVLEDLEEKQVVGSSLILAKHGNQEVPHSYFKILRKERFSQDLGIGFIHQVLRFQTDEDGPTEVGGLLVDRDYRRRPEKLGKQISLSRFNYMGMYPERFEKRVLCELTPPLTEEGRSEFWEALGRRFTGLPYQEADLLSQSHKEFIESLFPEEDIYVCLLDAKARTVIGRVGDATRPAQHLLESIGFSYLDEVDPFDGGPHFGCETKEILPIKLASKCKVTDFPGASYKSVGLVGTYESDYRCSYVSYDLRNKNEIALPAKSRAVLGVDLGQEIFLSPLDFPIKTRG